MTGTLGSRFLDEMTSREAKEVMDRTSAVILPVGTVELHGTHLPMGCDGFIAAAFAVKLAEKIDALVAPLEHYSFIGATSKFPGGVSVPYSASMEFLRHIVRGLAATGFRKIILVSFHYPNAIACDAVAREMFEETGLPVVNLRVHAIVSKELVKSVIGEKDDNFEEAALCAGALKILGKLDLVEPAAWRDAPFVPVEESARRVLKAGAAGYYFTSENSHVPQRAGVDPGMGVEIIERATDKLKGIVADLDDYMAYLRKTYGRV